MRTPRSTRRGVRSAGFIAVFSLAAGCNLFERVDNGGRPGADAASDAASDVASPGDADRDATGSRDAGPVDVDVVEPRDATSNDTATMPDAMADTAPDLGADVAPACDGDATLACEALTTDCRIGMCDEAANGCVTTDLPDGMECTLDGLSCTEDFCAAGACSHPIRANYCLIAGECYAAGDPNPANPCEECRPADAQDAFSPIARGAACDDMDGHGCTGGVCNGAGVCEPVIGSTNCLINDVCRTDGQVSNFNECRYCNAGSDQTAWTFFPDGTPCTAVAACTTATCQNQTCTQTIDAASCYIDGVCYASGAANPANPCQSCTPAVAQDAWTDRPQGAICGNGCTCEMNACVKNNGTPC